MNPVITLLTDFGTRDAYPGIMKGVVLGIAPATQLVDLTHEIDAQDILAGALVLRSAVEFFPAGTIHVAVVDPGVGSQRRPLLVATERGWFIGPDNGLLHPAASASGIREVRVLDRTEYFRPRPGQTFHGRDVFAPVAGHLAAGVSAGRLGTLTDAMVELSLPTAAVTSEEVRGEVIHVDRFGNLVTNIGAEQLAAFRVAPDSVSVAAVSAPIVSHYSAVPAGSPLALISSWGLVEIAVRDGNAAAQLKVGRGTPVVVAPRKPVPDGR